MRSPATSLAARRSIRAVVACLSACAALAFSGETRADDAPSRRGPSLWDELTAGDDLIRSVPEIAVFDGSWSLSLQAGTALTNHTWDSWRGPFAHVATRVLYGTTWTVMLAAESLIARRIGGGWGWLERAEYQTDWLVGAWVPAGCPSFGANVGCGVGIGSFAGLHGKLRGAPVWVEVSGGWIQQRVARDSHRTLAESTWIMTPLHVGFEAKLGGRAVELRLLGGPGIYFGMHNAHVHPDAAWSRADEVPWHEMVPLDAGLGPGGRAHARLGFGQMVAIEGEAVLAPFFVGGPTSRPAAITAPLDAPRSGLSTWRRASFGVSSFVPPLGLRMGLFYWLAELSSRPILDLGHQAVVLRFEVPLRLGAVPTR